MALVDGDNYVASPTGARFHRDNNFARFIMGPFGSGKTTTGLLEVFLRGMVQAPDSAGKRRSRALIVRNSYPELRSTTIPSFLSWFRGLYKITYTSPIQATVSMPLPDGTTMEQLVYFIGLDDESSASKLMSLELTFAFIDEFVFIPERILDVISGRIGRYPEMRHGGPTWYGYFGTSNPCPVEHWYYKMAEEEKPEGFTFYRQPPGLIYGPDGKLMTNPDAENLKYLPEGYYENQAIGKDEDYIKIYLMGEYGELRTGQPVYPSYDDKVHCAKEEFGSYPGIDIIIGVDFGLHGNAAAFCQVLPTGEFVIIDELLTENQSITEFVRDTLKPHIYNNYFKHGFRIICDPAAVNRSQSNKKSGMDILAEYNLPAETAITNEFTARKESVVHWLTKKDGFLLNPKCHMARRGFISHYKYEEVRNSNGRIKDAPEKNIYSHIHDAIQYASLYYKRFNVRRRFVTKKAEHTTPVSVTAGY